MFHFDRKLQQQESDTSSASDSTSDVISRIGVITPTEDEEDAEARGHCTGYCCVTCNTGNTAFDAK